MNLFKKRVKRLAVISKREVIELWGTPHLEALLRDSHYLITKSGSTIYGLRELPVSSYKIVPRKQKLYEVR